MHLNEAAASKPMRPATGLRPYTGCAEIDRTLAVSHAVGSGHVFTRTLQMRTLGRKRVVEAQTAAKGRFDVSHPEWFDEKGDIVPAGDFILGLKGGKWSDKKPIAVSAPLHPTLPPSH